MRLAWEQGPICPQGVRAAKGTHMFTNATISPSSEGIDPVSVFSLRLLRKSMQHTTRVKFANSSNQIKRCYIRPSLCNTSNDGMCMAVDL